MSTLVSDYSYSEEQKMQNNSADLWRHLLKFGVQYYHY